MSVIIMLFVSFLEAGIVNGPYIDNLSKDTLSLRFNTDDITVAWFSWGEYPKCDKYLTVLVPKKDHTVNLYGLKPSTKYCYNIFLPLENSTFSYLVSSSVFTTFFDETYSSFSFIVYSNTVLNSMDENRKLVSLIISSHTDISLCVNLGNFLNSTLDFVFPGEFKDISAYLPIYTALASREYENYKDKLLKDEYRRFRSFSKNGFSPHYYYVDIATSRLIFLDNNPEVKNSVSLKKQTKQYQWLKEVLEYSNSKKYLFVFINDGIYPSSMDINMDLEETFLKYKVDFVFQNGNFPYLRTRKIKYGTESDDGIFYIMLGNENYSQTFKDISDIPIEVIYKNKGFLKVSVYEQSVYMDYYNFDGSLIDKFVYSK